MCIRDSLKSALHKMLDGVEKKFRPMAAEFRENQNIAERLQGNGTVTDKQAEALGWVGLCAKMCGVPRDARCGNTLFPRFVPVTLPGGDAYARALVRLLEIEQSFTLIRTLLDETAWPRENARLPYPTPSAFEPCVLVCSVVEGWRGEIVHAAVTDERGGFATYKIVDPSFRNWKALELSMRNTEIADFPVNNKSYDLSYCGFDL
jgi:Ni,Fe-hydrogenase III large subunit